MRFPGATFDAPGCSSQSKISANALIHLVHVRGKPRDFSSEKGIRNHGAGRAKDAPLGFNLTGDLMRWLSHFIGRAAPCSIKW
ncbi:MAG: hypothetical protein LBQ32_07770 [Burkholderiaceae bacterium]|nr:hypothetical protein [Burkholderiaceae bacterium]